jgi:hypothetical protein
MDFLQLLSPHKIVPEDEDEMAEEKMMDEDEICNVEEICNWRFCAPLVSGLTKDGATA